MKIGILYICTGNYVVFWKDFYESMEKNFITDAERHYFVFTDSEEIDFENNNNNIHRIYQSNLGWPDNTLKRFHIFIKHEENFTDMDYLFFFNANLIIMKSISSDEFLPSGNENLVSTIHPGFYNKKRSKFTYDKNPNSTAYIPNSEGIHYFAGGLNGGRTQAFIDAMKKMRENIDIDNEKSIVAKWHDESHWNRYLIGRSDVKYLDPSYLYPEGWLLPFEQVILIRDKNKYGGHNTLRNANESNLKNTFLSLVKKIPNLSKLLFYTYKNGTNQSRLTNLVDAKLLIITIAFNNSKVLEAQYIYLKENLKDDFMYLIADNSSIVKASEEIEELCKGKNIPYIKLPPNPYHNPSRSHGIALNWLYRNIIRKYRPKYFGFVDHDIFPFRPTTLVDKLNGGLLGLIQERGTKWYMWAGFCFYDFQKLSVAKFNFMPCRGLDTGGSNYNALYKKIDKNSLVTIPQIYIDTNRKKKVNNISDKNTATTIECIGDWIHLMRASNWNTEKNNKTSSLEEIVSRVKEIL